MSWARPSATRPLATDSPSRALALTLYRAAVEGAAPFPKTRDAVRQWFHTTAATPYGVPDAPVHVIALGKAATAMTAGAIDALRSVQREVTSGIVVTSHAPTAAELRPAQALPDVFTVHVGDHPVPGPASLDAADAISDAIVNVSAGDLVLVLLSGGTTALTAAPLPALSQRCGDAGRAQAHIANLTQTLLESGLAIHEMNAVRRRVLRWSAGRLAVALQARGAAQVAVFAISDVIGDAPEVIGSGPCSPEPFDDTTIFALIDAHNLRPALEHDMACFLGLAGDGVPPAVPDAHHPAFAITSYHYVARNADAVAALASAARAAGISHVAVEPTPLEGEAAELGDHIARMAVGMATAMPKGDRGIWIAGGEPVVHLRQMVERAIEEDENDGSADEPMKGGRMQALALSASMTLEQHHGARGDAASRITLLAAGTDGRDGPTDAAGAIVDCATPYLAQRHGGRRPERDLTTGRSWFSLDAANSLVRVGPTGTNVMDIVAVLIDAQ